MIQILFNKIYLLLFLFVIFIRCNNSLKDAQETNIRYSNKILPGIIKSYLATTREVTADSVISIDLKESSDTTIISIANSFPDLRQTKYVGLDTLNGYTIYFIGPVNKNFYTTRRKESPPLKALNANRIEKKFLPPSSDPKQWIFYFKDTTLIGYFPVDEIREFYKK